MSFGSQASPTPRGSTQIEVVVSQNAGVTQVDWRWSTSHGSPAACGVSHRFAALQYKPGRQLPSQDSPALALGGTHPDVVHLSFIEQLTPLPQTTTTSIGKTALHRRLPDCPMGHSHPGMPPSGTGAQSIV
jgi:hypothetical protein